MIIELGKYNSAEGLLIGIRTAGSQGHVCNRDGDWRISVTRVAVHMKEKGAGMRTGYRGTYNWSLSWE